MEQGPAKGPIASAAESSGRSCDHIKDLMHPSRSISLAARRVRAPVLLRLLSTPIDTLTSLSKYHDTLLGTLLRVDPGSHALQDRRSVQRPYAMDPSVIAGILLSR